MASLFLSALESLSVQRKAPIALYAIQSALQTLEAFRKLFKSTLNNRLHRNLDCVIDKSSRGAKLKRAFEELPLHFLSLVTPVAHLPTPSHSSNGFFESLPHTEPPKTSGFPLNRLRNDGHTAHRSEIEAPEHPFYDVMCYSTFGSFSFGGYMVLTCFWKNFIMSFASPVS